MKPTSIRFFPKRLGSRPTTSRLFHHPRKESSYMQHHVVGSHFLPTFDRDTLLYLIESASPLPIPFKFHSLYQHSNLHSYACYVDSQSSGYFHRVVNRYIPWVIALSNLLLWRDFISFPFAMLPTVCNYFIFLVSFQNLFLEFIFI